MSIAAAPKPTHLHNWPALICDLRLAWSFGIALIAAIARDRDPE